MLRVLALLLLFPLAVPAQRHIDVSRTEPNSGVCPRVIIYRHANESAERAAIIALWLIMRLGDPVEHGGFVVEQNGVYRFSNAQTQGERFHVDWCIPPDVKLAAMFHSHLSSPEFSPLDRQTAERWGVPIYIGTLRGGRVLRYDPETGRTETVGRIVATDLDAMRFTAAE